MIKYSEIEIKDSLLPRKKWKINEEGKWRAYSQDGEELFLSNYPIHQELPQELSLPSYSDSEYQQSFESPNWTREETDFLYELCCRFALRFPVIQDRFNEKFKQQRTVEDLKERYFGIAKVLQMKNAPNEPCFTYDKEMDLKRKQALGSLHARPSEAGAEENFVIDYLTKFQQNGEMQARLAERIAIIKTLAGEQFTAGWPTLPELLKIAAGKGGNRFIDKSAKKQKKKKRPAEVTSSAESSPQRKKSVQSSKPVVKKPKTSSSSTSGASSACNIYLRSSKMQPLRVGSARAVEKILADFGLPLKPRTPTSAVVEKYDRLRSLIIQLIDARKAANKLEQ